MRGSRSGGNEFINGLLNLRNTVHSTVYEEKEN